ncbi:hypothetical protein PARU111607_11400 [Palleronia rufa]
MSGDLFAFDPQNVPESRGRRVAVEGMGDLLRGRTGAGAIVFVPLNEGMSRISQALSRLGSQ